MRWFRLLPSQCTHPRSAARPIIGAAEDPASGPAGFFMRELMYDVNAGLIIAVLLITVLVVIEIGFRFGHRRRASADDDSKGHINAIASSTLGIMALLLAFTFSLSLQRFDTRSDAVVDEANAIGTAYLRARLLPPSLREPVTAKLRAYVDLRLEADAVSTVDDDWLGLLAQATRLQGALWEDARRAAELEPNPVTSGLFIQALNDLIDSFGRRDAALNRHVPEIVLWLLFVTFLISALIVGFATGFGGRRPSWVTFAMTVLIAVLVFVILDLDRPRRGLIKVSEKSLLDLQASIKAESATSAPGAPGQGAASAGQR